MKLAKSPEGRSQEPGAAQGDSTHGEPKVQAEALLASCRLGLGQVIPLL